MPRQVRFDHYGSVDVLYLAEIDQPVPAEGQLLIAVKAAGVNPFDGKLRSGFFEKSFSIDFPAPSGTDVAGVVEAVGPGVDGFKVGDEVLGSTGKRGAQADCALLPAKQALERPQGLAWEVAGGFWTVASAASALIAAASVGEGDHVLVAGSGGVGGLACQLAHLKGASVICVTDAESQAWLRSLGITPVVYGDGAQDRIVAALDGAKLDALLDTAGHGYVELAVELGVAPERIDTIVDFDGAEKYGARTDGADAASTAQVGKVLALVAAGKAEFQIHASFPLDQVSDAYAELEQRHPRGKVVLIP